MDRLGVCWMRWVWGGGGGMKPAGRVGCVRQQAVAEAGVWWPRRPDRP